ncbi:MAG: CopD family protein, partial [Acidimicrobiaceae bacterium]|nr:CopD family protein [Acidimicrobiaceae bacterium]
MRLAPALTIVRLSLHVLAATVWVGGQLTLAGLVPALRRVGAGATQAAAQRFAQLAWPAFIVLVGTGIWNVADSSGHNTGAWNVVLGVKIAVVVVAGAATGAHQRARSNRGLAVFGGLAGLAR